MIRLPARAAAGWFSDIIAGIPRRFPAAAARSDNLAMNRRREPSRVLGSASRRRRKGLRRTGAAAGYHRGANMLISVDNMIMA